MQNSKVTTTVNHLNLIRVSREVRKIVGKNMETGSIELAGRGWFRGREGGKPMARAMADQKVAHADRQRVATKIYFYDLSCPCIFRWG